MKKEIPMLMSTEMVQAILAGRKTMTRRIVKPQLPEDAHEIDLYNPHNWNEKTHAEKGIYYWSKPGIRRIPTLPYGLPGDMIWVRESWNWVDGALGSGWYIFKASEENPYDRKWKPSIHMPKEAARIWLEVTDVRVERLCVISEDDAIAEGIQTTQQYRNAVSANAKRPFNSITAFMYLWEDINGVDTWNKNPWVWVVSFKVLGTTGKPENLN